jgi:hypothetical protein
MSSLSQVAADTPKVVWALDFQFDSTINSKAIKIASMLDEHTRESLLNIVERSITAERLIEELRTCFAAAGEPPLLLCCAWTTDRNSFPKHCNHFALDRSDSATSRLVLRGITASSNNRLRRECLNRNHWTNLTEARWSSATSSTSTIMGIGIRPWATARRPSTLRHAGTPITPWPARSTESERRQPNPTTPLQPLGGAATRRITPAPVSAPDC